MFRLLKTAPEHSNRANPARRSNPILLLAVCVSAAISPANARDVRKADAQPQPRRAYDDTVPGLLTLNAAKRIAYEHNWDLLAAQAGVDLALAQKIVAREFPNPTFS